MTKEMLFLELAQPDENGISRWVDVAEFVDKKHNGKYEGLKLGNGGSWCRRSSSLAKKYIIETEKAKGAIIRIRLNGFNKQQQFKQAIRKDIKDFYKSKNCVMLGVNGKSENTTIEIDHKDGRKDDSRIANPATQKLEDFQPLCKAANDIKRQICKRCRETNKRWDAKNIPGNPYSFYCGDENWNKKLGCVGCYQYDPVEYRKQSVKRISKEAAEIIAKKLFGDDA